ncbi:hypothetical protein [Streptomyces syringium]|uniref:hypothetical protein n=1 Tax=Streptomyces syringium TaxID=76729 RepID=UPI003AAE409E
MYGTQDQVTAYLDKAEFDLAYRRATAGGGLPSLSLPDVLVAVTLTPFITAVAASLGSGLGERIETAALRILRRVPRPAILHRSWMLLDAGEESGDPTEEGAADGPVDLRQLARRQHQGRPDRRCGMEPHSSAMGHHPVLIRPWDG